MAVPIFISPLDETYMTFGGASSVLAGRDPLVSATDMLDMLVRAMWRGDFNPPASLGLRPTTNPHRSDPENWLCAAIEAPPASLTAAQKALRPQPVEFFSVSRNSILSVMLSRQALPGDPSGWTTMFDRRANEGINREAEAMEALVRIPLSAYPSIGRTYIEGIFIPRIMLQAWLDQRSSKHAGLFYRVDPPSHSAQAPRSPDAADDVPPIDPSKRGRPNYASWAAIEAAARKLRTEHPNMLNKTLAHEVRRLVLGCFDDGDVPSEATIIRRLHAIIAPPRSDTPSQRAS